jgi:hypothetical protein
MGHSLQKVGSGVICVDHTSINVRPVAGDVRLGFHFVDSCAGDFSGSNLREPSPFSKPYAESIPVPVDERIFARILTHDWRCLIHNRTAGASDSNTPTFGLWLARPHDFCAWKGRPRLDSKRFTSALR